MSAKAKFITTQIIWLLWRHRVSLQGVALALEPEVDCSDSSEVVEAVNKRPNSVTNYCFLFSITSESYPKITTRWRQPWWLCVTAIVDVIGWDGLQRAVVSENMWPWQTFFDVDGGAVALVTVQLRPTQRNRGWRKRHFRRLTSTNRVSNFNGAVRLAWLNISNFYVSLLTSWPIWPADNWAMRRA